MKIILYLITGLWLFSMSAMAQPDCSFTHYSSDDGLSQNTVMSILQDHKGVMWFATWDGINKFDGYTFKSYKARSGNHIELTNNRIDFMEEDRYGFIWLLTYDSQPYRFNPSKESFERVFPDDIEKRIPVSSVHVLANGTVWLLTGKEDAYRVETDSITHQLTLQSLRSYGEEFASVCLYKVFLDKQGREWLLTNQGLAQYDSSGRKVHWMKEEPEGKTSRKRPFFVCCEGKDDLLFGSDRGFVWCFHKDTGKFFCLQLDTSSDVVAIHAISDEEWLLATRADGFYVGHPGQKRFTHYAADRLPKAPIESLYADRGGEIWFEQHVQGTVAHFNPRSCQLKTEIIPVEPTRSDRSHPAFHVHEDCYGTVWVHPYGGGFSRFDRDANTLVPFFNSLSQGEWRFSNKVHSAFSDRQGNLWLCTHSKGVEKISFRSAQIHRLIQEKLPYESLSNEVRALFEDDRQNIWVGLKDGKLRIYDKQLREKGYLTESGTIAKNGRPMRGTVYNLMQDHDKNMWIATKGDGLVKAEPRGEHYRLTRYQYDADNPFSLSDNNVYCVHEDGIGRLWVATFGGGVNILTHDSSGQEVFLSHRNRLKHYPQDQCAKVRFITEDAEGNVWIATTVGALLVKRKDTIPEAMRFRHFVRIPDDVQSLSHNDVHWIISTRQKELYFATFGGGLNKLLSFDADENARFRSYSVDDGLPSDVLLSVREDDRENLWISTENGICKFVPSEQRFEKYSDKSVPFRIRFSEAASAYTSDKQMMFGTNNGIFMFNPDTIRKSEYVSPIVFSKLLVANEEVLSGKSPILSQHVDDVKKLTLSHQENIFTIQYAALDYSNPAGVHYAYRLEGFEKNWNYVGEQRAVTYTNLPKGHYSFKVRSTNADGVWVDNERVLDVEVLPSFWETPVAYLIYFLLLILIIVIAVYILFTIYRLKHRVLMEHQMTDMKLRFFTDISHELRTPLTLIVGPVENVLKNYVLPDDVRNQLKVVSKNTNRMLRLINQILDFRKIQNKKMKLRVQCIDLIPFTRSIMDNFEGLAEERHITFKLESAADRLFLWADADKYEKIVFNLLSNAFKYTPDGRCITVFVREDEQHLSVGVQDQGVGIDENRRQSIFLRFENLVDRNLFTQSSTGIGLSLVNELAEMHHATIAVDSRVGEGSCFRVDFLKGKEHYDASVEILQDDVAAGMNQPEVPAESISAASTSVSASVCSTEDGNANRELMLLVEDNRELRQFLVSIFASNYRIIEAENGAQGLELAQQQEPDIIVSDVMMPVMDGITLTRELRANLITSHIPLILLTAKTSIESQLEGLEYGADDYITKPFSATYLKARVRNLLTSRFKLQEIYRKKLLGAPAGIATVSPSVEAVEAPAPVPQEPAMSQQDRKFMDKLMELMEKNLDNGDLVVDDLVQEMAVSRSVFFKKLKTLTGLAPIEFIKEMRISRSVQLIETGEYSMTQISYMVGINDPRYFSKCFKQKMGMTPTEYREQMKTTK